MEVMQHSLFGRLMFALLTVCYGWYEESLLALIVRGGSAGFRRLWRGSYFARLATREGGISRGWKHSLFAQLFSVIINLPGLILRAIYGAFRPVFTHSVAARIGFGIVENTPIAAGWLMLLILVIPYEAWNNAYSLMGFGLMLIFAILSGMRRSRRLDSMAMGPYVMAFAGFVALAWPLSFSSALSQRFFLYHLACMLCVLVIVSTVEKAAQLKRLAGMATLGLIAVSVYGVVQRIQGVEVNPSYVDLTLNADMPGRVYSVFENPNAFGEVLVLLIPLAVGLMFASRSWGGKLMGLCGAGLGSVALIMTYSRADWVGLMAAAVLFVFLWNRKILPVFLVLGIAAIPFLPDTVLNRALTIFNLKDTSTASRFPLYEAAVRLIQERPLRGTGLGSEVVRAAVKEGNLYHGEAPFVHSHSVYLQVWAETGLFGLLALLGSVGWTVKKAARAAFGKAGSYPVRMLVIGGVSALFGIMVCGIADYIWHYPRVMLIFWFVFAVTLAGIRLAQKEEKILRSIQRSEKS